MGPEMKQIWSNGRIGNKSCKERESIEERGGILSSAIFLNSTQFFFTNKDRKPQRKELYRNSCDEIKLPRIVSSLSSSSLS